MPLVTSELVTETLSEYFAEMQAEVHHQFPSDEDNVPEGVYVARCYQAERNVAQTAFGGRNTYDLVDRVELYLLSGQENPYTDDYLNVFAVFIDDAIFLEYTIREYSVDQLYEGNSERYRIILSLTRQEIS